MDRDFFRKLFDGKEFVQSVFSEQGRIFQGGGDFVLGVTCTSIEREVFTAEKGLLKGTKLPKEIVFIG